MEEAEDGFLEHTAARESGQWAQMRAATEGIIGQLFLAFGVARLVGMSLLAAQAPEASSTE